MTILLEEDIMARISVIIPVYNSERYLKKCLDSLLGQTFQDFEIIAVNDGSTDSSRVILDQYETRYPDTVHVYEKENGGQGAARNFGMERAAGEYLLFLDSDDYIEKNMLEVLYTAAVRDESDLVVCDYYEIEEDSGKTIARKAMQRYSKDRNVNYFLSNPSPWNKLIRLRVMREHEIRFLEHHIYEDLATLPILAGYAAHITYVEEPLYDYIIHAGSSMRQKSYHPKLESIFTAMAHLDGELHTRGFAEKYGAELEFLYIQHLLYAASGRFLCYRKGRDQLTRIRAIMKVKYPDWRKNKYYKNQSTVFKTTCRIFYGNHPLALKIYNKLRRVEEI